MTGRYCFLRCLSVNSSGGGGTPSQVWTRGVPHPRSGQAPPQPDLEWGTPPPRLGMGYPPRHRTGVPPSDLGWGIPPGHETGYPPGPEMGYPPGHGTGYPPRQISIASTCYTAGGMPLAFTQEDFLVKIIFTVIIDYL